MRDGRKGEDNGDRLEIATAIPQGRAKRPRDENEGEKTHIHEFVRIPRLWVILDDTSLCEKGDFDGVNTLLVSEHALDGLRGRPSCQNVKRVKGVNGSPRHKHRKSCPLS